MTKFKKIMISFFIIVSVGVAFLPQIDAISYENNDKFLKRATITFAIAKGMNGVISFLQGTEIGGSVVFANATFAVGELLDPLNDMVERFSWVMLASSIALAIEKILIQLGATESLKYVFLGMGVFLFFSLWFKSFSVFKTLSLKIFLILTLIRFIIPATELANTQIYAHFTKSGYEKSNLSLQETDRELRQVKQDIKKIQNMEDNSGFSNFFKNPAKGIKSSIDALLDKLERSYEDMKTLMAIFIFQSILIPLLSLYLGYRTVIFVLFSKHEVLLEKS